MNIRHYNTIDSTNRELHRLASSGAPENTIVVADQQSAGRGRQNRRWHSPLGGGLWFSILLRPPLSPSHAAPVTLVTAAVIAETINNDYQLPMKIKWPNDLFYQGKKTGGILTELKTKAMELDYLIIGIGLNIGLEAEEFPPELQNYATALPNIASNPLDRSTLLTTLLNRLITAFPIFFDQGFVPFQNVWKKYNITLGQPVTIRNQGKPMLCGLAVDLTASGALILEDQNCNRHVISFGEII